MSRRILAVLAGITLACGQAADDNSPDAGSDTTVNRATDGTGRATSGSDTASDGTGRTGAPGFPPPVPQVTIHFSRGDSTVAVSRRAHTDSAGLEDALRALLRGPDPGEREAGMDSWFSAATAGLLRSATVDAEGRAVVDFADLRATIPNASTSAGSAMLLRELNATVFEYPAVQSVEYRIEGSCDVFGEWLQYGCVTVARP
jgi:hypothetical protein